LIDLPLKGFKVGLLDERWMMDDLRGKADFSSNWGERGAHTAPPFPVLFLFELF
jgi:hypothetical protein